MARRKKIFPPGTFIPTPQRVLAIIQLCLAFSLFLWYGMQPFTGEYFKLKSRIILYEYITGTPNAFNSGDHKDRLERNRERLNGADSHIKQKIEADYRSLYLYATRPVLTKLSDGLKTLLFYIPAFELAWIFFASILSIFILVKKDGSKVAAWILPFIALFYGIDNQFNGYPHQTSPEISLFPDEKALFEEYIKEPPARDLKTQQEQLKKGWDRYLIRNWSKHPSFSINERSNDLSEERTDERTNERIEEAEFNFTLARLNALSRVPIESRYATFHGKSFIFWPALYLIWNLFFAFMISKQPFGFAPVYSRECIGAGRN